MSKQRPKSGDSHKSNSTEKQVGLEATRISAAADAAIKNEKEAKIKQAEEEARKKQEQIEERAKAQKKKQEEENQRLKKEAEERLAAQARQRQA